MFAVGEKIDNRYEVKGLLDSATAGRRMGTVYRVFDSVFNIERVIKTINERYSNNEELKERFRREAFTPTKIAHPGIITVLDFVEEQGQVPMHMVMELLADYDRLDKVISKNGPLDSADTIQLMTVLCSALDAAHQRQIVHRDVTSTNIFARKTSTGWCVKVIDFGIAKIPNEEEGGDATEITDIEKRERMGTRAYMAPEQFLNYSKVDCRADVYSLGVLSYELLSGNRLFPGADDFNYHQLHSKPIIFPDSIDIPGKVKDCVLRSLSADPNDRPSTAGAYAAQLKSALNEERNRLITQLRFDLERKNKEVAKAERAQKEAENRAAVEEEKLQRASDELARIRRDSQDSRRLSNREKVMIAGFLLVCAALLVAVGAVASAFETEREKRARAEQSAANSLQSIKAAESREQQVAQQAKQLEQQFKEYKSGEGAQRGISFHDDDVFVAYEDNILTFRYAASGKYEVRITDNADILVGPSWTENIPASPEKYYVVRRKVQKIIPNEFKVSILRPEKSGGTWQSYQFTKASGN